MLKSLPIGTYTFRDIIQGGSLYVDKTETIYELLRPSKGIFFLSRPRRFGKSLLISTLEEIFQGNRELFNGLWLYDSPYDWQIYPMLQIRRCYNGDGFSRQGGRVYNPFSLLLFSETCKFHPGAPNYAHSGHHPKLPRQRG